MVKRTKYRWLKNTYRVYEEYIQVTERKINTNSVYEIHKIQRIRNAK